jgi:GT2 family glycosyltransferase
MITNLSTRKLFTVIVTHNPMQWIDNIYLFLNEEGILANTILIDNCSTDNFKNWVIEQRLEKQVQFQNSNLGFGLANNIGMRIALEMEAEFVLLLNQDAWLLPGSLAILMQSMVVNPNYGIISPLHFTKSLDRLDNNFSYYLGNSDTSKYFEKKYVQEESCHIVDSNFINAAIWLMNTDVIKVVGGFNSIFFHYGEDDEYCQRLIKSGFKIGIEINAIGIHDRAQRVSKTGFKNKYLHNRITFILEYYTSLRKFALLSSFLKLIINHGCVYEKSPFLRIGICLMLLFDINEISKSKKTIKEQDSPFLF